MKSLLKYLRNDHIQIALCTGTCIIILALFFKKVLHVPVPRLESSLPSLVLVMYEVLRRSKKLPEGFWQRPWFWNLLMLLGTALVILRRIFIAE